MSTTRDYDPDLDSNQSPYRDTRRNHASQGKLERRRRKPRRASELPALTDAAYRRLLALLTRPLTDHWVQACDISTADNPALLAAFEWFGRHQAWRGITTASKRVVLEGLEDWCRTSDTEVVLTSVPWRRADAWSVVRRGA
jgi:hypothetical protein